MLTIVGKVIKKEKKKHPAKAELLVEVDGVVWNFQVRPKNISKLIEIDTNSRIQVSFTNNMKEEQKNGKTSRTTYLIAEDINIV